MNYILGLDISTTTIGLTLLNTEGEVEYIGYLKPVGDTMYEKVASAFKQLDGTPIKTFKISAIYAEQPNIMFKAGFSTAQTLSKILRFNGAFLFTLSQMYGILPYEVMAVSARKQVTGVGRFKTDPKTAVFKWVDTNSKTKIDWPTSDKGKNQGQPRPECFDMADSYIIARYGLIHESRAGQQQT
jgi:hypothetical protein